MHCFRESFSKLFDTFQLATLLFWLIILLIGTYRIVANFCISCTLRCRFLRQMHHQWSVIDAENDLCGDTKSDVQSETVKLPSMSRFLLITSPSRTVAKYCDEHVCLSVCQSVTRAIFTKFFVHVAYGRGSVLLWQGDEIPRGRDNFGAFRPQ